MKPKMYPYVIKRISWLPKWVPFNHVMTLWTMHGDEKGRGIVSKKFKVDGKLRDLK